MIEADAKKLLFEVDDIAREIDLQYILYGGTCLGAVRDKAFIDIDRDVDFVCLHEDFLDRYEELVEKLLQNQFEVEIVDHRHRRPWCGTPYGIKLRKYGISSDFFGWIKKGQWRYCPGHNEAYVLAHRAKHIQERTTIEFYGRTFNIPKDYVGFLNDKYGDWKNKHDEFDNVCKPTVRKEVRGGDDFWWV